MSETLKVSDDGRFRVRLEVQEGPANPRQEYDHLSHVITVDTLRGRYYDVDKESGPLGDGWDRIKGHNHRVEIFERWARETHGAAVLHDSPGEGAEAIWYLMPDQFGEVSDPGEYLASERDEYRAWAAGEVYGYIIEQSATWTPKDGGDEEIVTWGRVDSCWGYIGYDYAKGAALEEFERYIKA